MAVRTAEATWEGSLKEGKGSMKGASGAFESPFSFATRFEEHPGTNPEELLGAAHAGCFSMALSAGLGNIGFTPTRIHTKAQVTLGRVDGKARITNIHLKTVATVPGISPEKFQEVAEATRTGCPVSAALTGVEISLDARLA